MKKTVIRIFDKELQIAKIEILCMDMSLGSPIVMKINEAIDLYNVVNESDLEYDIKSEMYAAKKQEDMQGQG